ncbi:MoaD/ThiS family protein [Picrophilus oshimae]|uniref:Molybdopterin synthase subunit MoaD n=1 Tax=Picrophilus torridus (strain ATCC 700027 / DSM 9790 / JCM 10055 / NBRC 100828 / KAW 2/3) TaxID=1122961 RepID=A0A8G2FXF7_PICTO|nr:MoaD/ThiS family protein [Picrophilus oshimae]SMD31267.1 molybdopterin synthase subunit MoaD [Picrophilus oshimae DSM 9789]
MIRIIYFAAARDRSGTDNEYIDYKGSLTELKKIIYERHNDLKSMDLLFAVNKRYVDDCIIKDGDEIAVFPPVSGG